MRMFEQLRERVEGDTESAKNHTPYSLVFEKVSSREFRVELRDPSLPPPWDARRWRVFLLRGSEIQVRAEGSSVEPLLTFQARLPSGKGRTCTPSGVTTGAVSIAPPPRRPTPGRADSRSQPVLLQVRTGEAEV